MEPGLKTLPSSSASSATSAVNRPSCPTRSPNLDSLETAGLAAFREAADPSSVESARVEFLGQKQGRIKSAQERLKTLPSEAKRPYGQRFNAVKTALEAACESARGRVDRPKGVVGGIDVTLPGQPVPRLGHRHPLTQTAEELIDLFGRFGFSVARGPEVEDTFHNFEALNIPSAHPARDPSDNFYLGDETLLRSQTSTVQIRVIAIAAAAGPRDRHRPCVPPRRGGRHALVHVPPGRGPSWWTRA